MVNTNEIYINGLTHLSVKNQLFKDLHWHMRTHTHVKAPRNSFYILRQEGNTAFLRHAV